jgi:hypothetical protein
MITGSKISESLSRIILHPNGGIVSMVDDLLAVCRDEGLRIEWQNKHCHVRSAHLDESIDLSVSRSAFRAILARIAALCNERKPGSASPYGGQAELCLDSDPSTVFFVEFVNTAEEQRLDLAVRPI